jgi:hypothetical protein
MLSALPGPEEGREVQPGPTGEAAAVGEVMSVGEAMSVGEVMSVGAGEGERKREELVVAA